jgi:hypothetical protein
MQESALQSIALLSTNKAFVLFYEWVRPAKSANTDISRILGVNPHA